MTPDDQLNFEEADRATPIKGVCYYVRVQYNGENPMVRRKAKAALRKNNYIEEMTPLATITEVEDATEKAAGVIQRAYKGSMIYVRSAADMEDEYCMLILDTKQRPIAKLGIIAEDYRKETLQ